MNDLGSDISSSDEDVTSSFEDEDVIFELDKFSIQDEEEDTAVDSDQYGVNEIPGVDESVALKPRSYQLEMLEMSLERNIVVAMDTGSGKTQIAVLRIQAELEKCQPGQRVWFLAPTIVLCAQQYDVLGSQLPSVQMLHLSSADNVDRWTEKYLWEAILLNVQVVVSTHQILLDALSHGFVSMEDLALLVFDEAHYCQGRHPANLIMENFYHPSLQSSKKVPAVLGLTASPIVNKKGGLEILEQNLNAISKTPKLHRTEMMKHVHRPILEKAVFYSSSPPSSPAYERLVSSYLKMDLSEDPFVVELKSDPTEKNMNTLRRIFYNRKTYCQMVVKGICTRSTAIGLELGVWARDYYIFEAIRLFKKNMTDHFSQLTDWNDREKVYLFGIFDKIELPDAKDLDPSNMPANLSEKVNLLISILVREYNSEFSCIVFVQQRVAVVLLSLIFSLHPKTANLFKCAPFVGTSSSPHRTAAGVSDLVDIKAQKTTIEDLREGRQNVIFATSVLEEGIDISTCHAVICFDEATNLKSFIQRRGRARKAKSKFIMMTNGEDLKEKDKIWQNLEKEMIRIYQDDMRKLKEYKVHDEDEEGQGRFYKIAATGALLTFDNAVPHLWHFCNTLPRSAHSSTQPEVDFELDPFDEGVTAKIILPNSIDPSVRRARSIKKWRTEKMAKRDAAFEALIALHKAGLVDDHLLPLTRHMKEKLPGDSIERKTSIIECKEQHDPWVAVAKAWEGAESHSSAIIKITSLKDDEEQVGLVLTLPNDWPTPQDFHVYWKGNEVFKISCQKPQVSSVAIQDHQSTTLGLLHSALKQKTNINQSDFVALVTLPPEHTRFKRFLGPEQNSFPALELSPSDVLVQDMGLVYNTRDYDKAYIPIRCFEREVEPTEEPGPTEESGPFEEPVPTEKKVELCIEGFRFGKRKDFLHPVVNPDVQKAPAIIPAENCIVDKIPHRYAKTASFIPCILHRVSTQLLATLLSRELLAPLQISDTKLILTAITAPQARETYSYQSLEFLGDGVLKFITTVHLYSTRPTWHEGYLSARKDWIVSNNNLAMAALKSGLDGYIITKSFTGLKWKPLYISELLIPKSPKTRRLSSKILADVVEAIIGSSYLSGGIPGAIRAMRIFFPFESWSDTPNLIVNPHPSIALPPYLQPLESLTGHSFKHPYILLEAMTHPSQPTSGLSYQRLEFIGDSILGILVERRIMASSQSIPPATMHLMQIAVVSADILAFLCMELFVSETRHEIIEKEDDDENGENMKKRKTGTTFKPRATRPAEAPLHIVDREERKPLWSFLRHTSPGITRAQKESVERHQTFREPVWAALRTGTVYPWTTFACIAAEKFFSDIIESILGALFVDTGGDLDVCERFLTTLGLMTVLDRVIDGQMLIMPPKSRLSMWAAKRDTSVRYETGFMGAENGEIGVGSDEFLLSHLLWCQVFVADQLVCEIRDGRTKETVVSRAAEMAMDILEKRDAERQGKGNGKENGEGNSQGDELMT